MTSKTILTPRYIGRDVPWEDALPWIKQRLLSRVSKLKNGCWEYVGYKDLLGYGEMAVQGQNWRVHRLSYVVFKGQIPDGMQVCHSCDFRPCINPAHLWLGTHLDNQRDLIAKGRNPKLSQTHCKRGHDYAIYGRPKRGGGRSCNMCDLGRQRIRTGWPKDLAYSVTPRRGYRPPVAGPIDYKPRKNLSKDHCRRGHLFTPESTYVNPDGRRRCKICQLAAQNRRVYRVEQERP